MFVLVPTCVLCECPASLVSWLPAECWDCDEIAETLNINWRVVKALRVDQRLYNNVLHWTFSINLVYLVLYSLLFIYIFICFAFHLFLLLHMQFFTTCWLIVVYVVWLETLLLAYKWTGKKILHFCRSSTSHCQCNFQRSAAGYTLSERERNVGSSGA